MKLKESKITKKDLERIGRLRLKRAKEVYQSRPSATKVWMAMNYGFSMEFLKQNWGEITNGA